jgi:2-succinyl-5-enolpyruvyl-6-hydroxy-3-cyclohexene-1-carboxylate synthase
MEPTDAQADAQADAQSEAMRRFVEGLVAAGVRHAVVAPGSRSTPLALALVRDSRLTTAVVIDERSAAFRALGIGRATGVPAVVLCTSGSAAAHLHPAVLEAHHGRVPLIVATADRPPELQDTGAGQTIDQAKLYGNAVRWFAAPGAADAATLPTFAPVAARAVDAALGPPAGGVHVNLAFREPLVPDTASTAPAPPEPGPRAVRAGPPALGDGDVADIAALLGAARRGAIVAGWGTDAPGGVIAKLAHDLGWPLIADPISGCRTGAHAITAYEALLRAEAFAESHVPDLVLRFGAPLTSRTANEHLARAPHVVVDPDHAWLDPARTATTRIVATAADLAGRLSLRLAGGGFAPARTPPEPWLAGWLAAERRARAALDAALDADERIAGPRVARDLVAGLPDGTHLLVASSMAVREVEWFAPARAGLRLHANRGVNGIDGLVSTALGIAVGSGEPTVAFLGDLAFVHDTNGLLGAAGSGANLTIVVLDDDGGAIFSFLPQARACAEDEFERLFGTPHGLDLATVAEAHGVEGIRASDAGEVIEIVRRSLAVGGVRAVVVPADRRVTVAQHRALWDAVAEVVSR